MGPGGTFPNLMKEEKTQVTLTLTTRDRTKTLKSNDNMSDNSSQNERADSQMDYINPGASLQKSFEQYINLKSPTKGPNLNITKRLFFFILILSV